MNVLFLPKIKALFGDVAFGRATSATGITSVSGLTVTHLARAIFDYSQKDSSGVLNSTKATHGTGVFIPIKAIVTRAWYQVKTAPTSANTSDATIALTVSSAGDLVAAIAISDGSTPYATGLHGCLPGNPAEGTVSGDTQILAAARAAATYLGPLSAEKEISVTVAVDPLLTGRLIIYVEYHIGE